MTFQEVVALHPVPPTPWREALLRCAEECLDCAASCTACADASLSEADSQELTHVIRLCLDCADVCEATSPIGGCPGRRGFSGRRSRRDFKPPARLGTRHPALALEQAWPGGFLIADTNNNRVRFVDADFRPPAGA
jgi:hypothetical protein